MQKYLTTAEAARLAGVGVSSIKRWADRRLISTTLTPGGHRRVDQSDLLRFISDSTHAGAVPQTRDHLAESPSVGAPASAHEWARAALTQDSLSLQGSLLQARSRLGSWHAVADELGEGIREIGMRWAAGKITIAREHAASENLARALAATTEAIPSPPEMPTCLIACPEGEIHTLGLSMLHLCLRELHWRSTWIGATIPCADLCEAIRTSDASMVALSASAWSQDEGSLRRQLRLVVDACDASGAALVLGGRGAWPARVDGARRFHTFKEFSAFARRMR